MKKYIQYVENFHCNNQEEVLNWVKINLSNYLKDNEENQDEIEHILDYLCSNKAPKRLKKMVYKEAASSSEKWLKSLIKNEKATVEAEGDTEDVLILSDGFKWVKLVTEDSYKREGNLMRHCVGSGSYMDKNIYSLRDSNNLPHCTVEEDQQIKGKGNGNITPKYIGYVVEFLEYLGMKVSDNEMKNLGYFNIDKYKEDLHPDSLKLAFKNYLPISSKLVDKNGDTYFNLDLITDLGLIDNDGKILIDLTLLDKGVKLLLKNASSGDNTQNASSGYYTQNASSGNYTQNASSGNNTQNASSGDNTQNASSGNNTQNASSGDNTQNASSGYYTKNASSGDNTQNASSGYYTQNASSGNYTQNASSGNYTQNASSGNYTQNASSGDNTQNASSGYYTKNASSGNNTQNASSGYYTKNASSGYYTKNASSGDNTQNASSGYYTQNASSGNYTQNASSGNNTQNASSGDNTQNASSGNNTQNASSGDNTQNASSGYYTKNASSGNYTTWEVLGKNSVVASIGFKDKVKAVQGTWVTLAEYKQDENGIYVVTDVVSKRIDGVVLKENVYYSLVNGRFTEVE